MYGFFIPAAGGADGVKDGGADLSAALATAISDAEDDGTLYQTDRGDVFAWHNATKMLWPLDVYRRINGVMSNATGDAIMLKSDALADAQARGWVAATTGAGTATKSADGALVVTSPNPATSTAELQHTSSGSETSLACMFLVSGVTGTDMATTRARLLTANTQLRISLTNGAAGNVDILQNFNAVENDSGGNADVPSASDTWVLAVIDEDVDENVFVRIVEGLGNISVDANDALSGSYTPAMEFQTQNTTGIPGSLSIPIAAVAKLTTT